jgi:hypothetical protein
MDLTVNNNSTKLIYAVSDIGKVALQELVLTLTIHVCLCTTFNNDFYTSIGSYRETCHTRHWISSRYALRHYCQLATKTKAFSDQSTPIINTLLLITTK